MNQILDEDFISHNPTHTFKIGHVVTWTSMIIIGMLFKILHWPGNSLFLLLGFSGLLAYSTSGLIRLRGKSPFNNLTMAVAVGWALYVLYSYLFGRTHFWSLNGIIVYFVTTVVLFLIYEVVLMIRKKV